jgi:hypothetical protein
LFFEVLVTWYYVVFVFIIIDVFFIVEDIVDELVVGLVEVGFVAVEEIGTEVVGGMPLLADGIVVVEIGMVEVEVEDYYELQLVGLLVEI